VDFVWRQVNFWCNYIFANACQLVALDQFGIW